MLAVYGLKTCDTVRKALKWLEAEGIAYAFHDVRAEGVEEARVRRWAASLGWESVLNRRSTTWRDLPPGDTAHVDEARAVALMVAHPALIKRPVFEREGLILNGFTDEVKNRLK